MIVENQRSGLAGENGSTDGFPVGMRVLAVDDDPICLKVLENLLRICKYHVTTTIQAVQALKILRENRNMFDLVISDVNMPDMDGFMLLELVGLEMDLPVIMLSAHSDTELVMKGVTHGACDYLLKPVRIEELKNIWQHVIRRRKSDLKEQNNSIKPNIYQQGNNESEQAFSSTENGENGKLNRNKKHQNKDEEEEGEETEHENEDPSTQKKPRVVWSVELHRKFVAAVHQLGLDKAVPKKILDLMNLDGLKRENVASHLQKYRLYLKRITNVATQQANISSSLGVKDASYMPIGTIDGFGELYSLAGNGRFSNTPLLSYPPSGMLGRLNAPAGLTLHGIASSGLVQQGNSQNLNNLVTTLGKVEAGMCSTSQTPSIFQGIPTSLQISQLQPGKPSTVMKEFNTINGGSGFTLSNNSISTSSLVLQGITTQIPSRRGFGTESAKVASSSQDSFDIGINGSNNLDHNRCDENWNNAVQMSNFSVNPFDNYVHDRLTSDNMSISSTHSSIGRVPVDYSSTCAVLDPKQESSGDRYQEGLIGNIIQTNNVLPKRRLEENGHGFQQNMNNSYTAVDCMGSSRFLGSSMDQNNAAGRKVFDVSFGNHLIADTTPSYVQHGNNLLYQAKSQDGAVQSNYDSFNDVMNAMIKQEQNEASMMEGGFGFNAYSLEL